MRGLIIPILVLAIIHVIFSILLINRAKKDGNKKFAFLWFSSVLIYTVITILAIIMMSSKEDFKPRIYHSTNIAELPHQQNIIYHPYSRLNNTLTGAYGGPITQLGYSHGLEPAGSGIRQGSIIRRRLPTVRYKPSSYVYPHFSYPIDDHPVSIATTNKEDKPCLIYTKDQEHNNGLSCCDKNSILTMVEHEDNNKISYYCV